ASPGRPAVLGLRGLDALLEPVRAVGLHVESEVDVPPGAVSDATDAAAYRIVQEALTNLVRHAGAHHVRVAAVVADGVLRVSVTDDGRGSAEAVPGAGIAGMRERTLLLGGTFSAAYSPGGGFAVVA